jgi:hypothetical protein
VIGSRNGAIGKAGRLALALALALACLAQLALAAGASALTPLGPLPGSSLPEASESRVGGVAVGLDGTVFFGEAGPVGQVWRTLPGGSPQALGAGTIGGTDLATGPDGSVYVVDAERHQVVRFDPSGTFLRAFGSNMLGEPRGIGVSADGRVYVTDIGLDRVLVFTPTGEPLTGFETADPSDVLPLEGSVLVASPEQRRIDVFDHTYDFVGAFGKGVAAGGGDVCSADCQAGEASGGARALASPMSLAAAGGGRVYVSDPLNRRISLFTFGAFSSAYGIGVRDGSDRFQACTAVSGCQAGVPAVPPGTGLEGIGRMALGCDRTLYVAQNTEPPHGASRVLRFEVPETGVGTCASGIPRPPAPGRVTLKRLRLDRAHGRAVAVVQVSEGGRLVLRGPGLARVEKDLAQGGETKLVIRPVRGKRRALLRRGSVAAVAVFAFRPAAGGDPDDLAKPLKLRKRR